MFEGLLEDAPKTTANANVAESTADGDSAEHADLAADDNSDEEESDAEAAELGAHE